MVPVLVLGGIQLIQAIGHPQFIWSRVFGEFPLIMNTPHMKLTVTTFDIRLLITFMLSRMICCSVSRVTDLWRRVSHSVDRNSKRQLNKKKNRLPAAECTVYHAYPIRSFERSSIIYPSFTVLRP